MNQGIAAELVAARWGIERDELDALALASHDRAAMTADTGGFDAEIVPIETPDGGRVVADETIRRDTSPEALASLPAAFVDEAAARRFPEIGWRISAGNSSQISDGAAAMLIASAELANELDLEPMARFRGSAVAGVDPIVMLTGPIPATRRVLERTKLELNDVDHVEVNEAFASVPIAWERELGADPERVNPCGGAIALGHPLGASGARLLTTAVHALQRRGGDHALVTMCEAGGMANATVIDRI